MDDNSITQLSRRNPLNVSSLTAVAAAETKGHSTQSREGVSGKSGSTSSSSSSSTTSRNIHPEGSSQREPSSKSDFFTCSSIEETLRSHGASLPTRSPRFRFQMRQEPKHGLAVGDDELAYRNARVTPLDPMPICEMISEGNDEGQFLSLPEISVQARLVKSDFPFQEILSEKPAIEPLINGVQESGFIAPVAARHEECLFVFAELGVRKAGHYRIRFDLIDRIGLVFKRVATIYSQSFKIASDKKSFLGLTPSSELIHQLVRRGLKLRIIKDPQESKRATSSSTTQYLTESNKKLKGSQDNLSDYKSSASPSEDSVRIARPPDRPLAGSERTQSQPIPMSQSQPLYHPQTSRLDPKYAHSTDTLSWKQQRQQHPPEFLQSSARSSSYTSSRDAPSFQTSPLRISSPFGNVNQSRDGEQASESIRRVGWLRRDLPLPYPPDPLSSPSFQPKNQPESSSTTTDSSISTPSYPSIDRSHTSTLPIRNKYTSSQSPPNPSSRTIEDSKMTPVLDLAPFYPSIHSLSSEHRSSGERRSTEHPLEESRGLTLPPISSFQTRLPSMRHPEESLSDEQQRYHR